MRIKSILAIGIRVLVSFLSFLLTYVISSKLSVSDSSIFFLFLSLQSIVLVFFTIGLTDYIIKNGSSVYTEKLQFSGFFFSCISLVSMFSICSCIIFYFIYIGGFISIENINVFYIIFSFVPISLIALISGFFQAKKFSYQSIFISGILPFIFCTATFFISDVNFDMVSKIYFISAIVSILLYILLFFFIFRPSFKESLNFKFIKDYELFNMFIVQILFQMFSQNAILMMGFFDNSYEVSFLAVSLRIITCISIVLLAINKVISSEVAISYKNKDIIKLKKILKNSSQIMIVICFPLICIILIFPQEIMSIFGSKYKEYYNVLRILALGQIVNIFTGNVGLVLSMTGFVAYLRKSMFIGLALSVLLGFILIPMFGVIGAAWCVAISTAAINLLSSYYVKKNLNINMLKVPF
ncbi:hypothetical protein [Vibrio casei]|uniref:hypothetical protein n=1 Tax=Vibrio casei TaxID=673372 RepID=UPI003F9D7818